MSIKNHIELWSNLVKESEQVDEETFGVEYQSFLETIAQPIEGKESSNLVLFRVMDEDEEQSEIESSILEPGQHTFVLPTFQISEDPEEIEEQCGHILTEEGIELVKELAQAGDCIIRQKYDFSVVADDSIERDYSETDVSLNFTVPCDCAMIDLDKIDRELGATLIDVYENPDRYIIDYDQLTQKFDSAMASEFENAKENAKVSSDKNFDDDGNQKFADEVDESTNAEDEDEIDESRKERDSGIPLNKIDRRVSPEWWMTVAAGGNTSGLASEGCKLYPGKKVKAGSIVLWKRGEVRGMGTSITWPEYCFAIKHKDAEAMKKIEELGLPLDLDLGVGFDFDDYFVGGVPEVSHQAVTEEEEIVEDDGGDEFLIKDGNGPDASGILACNKWLRSKGIKDVGIDLDFADNKWYLDATFKSGPDDEITTFDKNATVSYADVLTAVMGYMTDELGESKDEDEEIFEEVEDFDDVDESSSCNDDVDDAEFEPAPSKEK